MSTPKIGFIGLGAMGSAMAQRLLDKGYGLTVLGNTSRTNIDAAVARGAVEAETAKQLAQKSDIVMLCMGTSQNVEDRMEGSDGVIAGLQPFSVVIDFGTSLPASTKALGAKVAAQSGHYLDAPLGRTPAHAVDGKLNIMCSGSEDGFEKAQPVLKDLGENVFYLGALGTGHTVKLINNFFGMTTAAAMAEAFVMADVAGIDRKTLYDVMSAGPLHSGMMDFVKGYGIDEDPSKLEFSIKNACKDLGYYNKMAKGEGIDSVMARSTYSALVTAMAEGHGDKTVSQMVDFFAKRYGRE